MSHIFPGYTKQRLSVYRNGNDLCGLKRPELNKFRIRGSGTWIFHGRNQNRSGKYFPPTNPDRKNVCYCFNRYWVFADDESSLLFVVHLGSSISDGIHLYGIKAVPAHCSFASSVEAVQILTEADRSEKTF